MSSFAVIYRKLSGAFDSRFLLTGSLLAGLFLATIVAHNLSAADSTGPVAVLDHIFDVGLALFLSLLLLLVGFTIANKLRLVFRNKPECLSFSLFIGVGSVGLPVLFLGLLGLLHPIPMIGLLVVLLTASYREVPSLYQIIKSGLLSATATRERRVLAMIFICFATLLLLRAASPPHSPDELIYHLPVPKSIVEKGQISPSYDNSLANVPLLIHMVYVLCLAAGSDIAAKIISLTFALTTAIALYGFCARYLSRRVGAIALFGFFGSGMVVEVAVTARIDVTLAGMLFMTTYAMINYFDSDDRRWLWTSAILAGFSLGIKHSAGLWVVLLGAMYLVQTLFSKREKLIPILKHGLAYAFIAAAIASPWYVKNYVWFKNPVYPFFTGEVAVFGPEGIRYFNSEDERRLDAHFVFAKQEIPNIVDQQKNDIEEAVNNRVTRHPMRLWEFFTRPNAYLMGEPYHFPNYLFLLTPLVLFLKPDRWIKWLAGLGVVFALTVTWSSWIARYLLPAYPAMTVVSAFTLAGLSDSIGPARLLSQRAPVWALALAIGSVVLLSVVSLSYFHTLRFHLGGMSRHQFLRQFRPQGSIDFINSNLPSKAKILTIGSQVNYGIEREYTSDETWFATKWRRLLIQNQSLAAAHQDLKRQEFTHILYCPNFFTFAANMGFKGTGGMDLIAKDSQALSDEERRLGPEYQLLRNWSTFALYRQQFAERMYLDHAECEVLRIK